MIPQTLEEYKALRATIRQRGTIRICLFAAGLVAWGALTITTAALAALPVATFLPLLVLAGFFEAIFALHIGVERIGRYIQVFFEEAQGAESGPGIRASNSGTATAEAGGNSAASDVPESAAWERAAMAFGRPAHAPRMDPLFSAYFVAAAILNFVPAALAEPVPLEAAVVGAGHLLFIVRIVAGRRVAARQRTIDLDRFRQLKRGFESR